VTFLIAHGRRSTWMVRVKGQGKKGEVHMPR
jgi:hypothetical protein